MWYINGRVESLPLTDMWYIMVGLKKSFAVVQETFFVEINK